ncbi:MAG: PAS domain-containing sensor histidine kinase [Nannocystales bacterium]
MNPQSFAELAKLVPAPMILLDAAGRVLKASPGLGRKALWLAHPEERLLTDLVEDPQEDITQYLQRCRRSSQPSIGAVTLRNRETDGSGIRCRCYGAGVAQSEGTSRLVVLRLVPVHTSGEHDPFQTLTERIRRRDDARRGQHESAVEVAASERRLSYLVETTQDAVVFIDGEHNIDRFNASAEQTFGYAREEVLGKPVTMLMPEPHQSKHERYIARYEETGEAQAVGQIREVRALRKDGTEFPMELSVTPLEPEAGRYAAFIRDTSRRRALQERILSKERLAAVGETAAMFAHEVSNPLNGMSMHAQLLERRLKKAGVDDEKIKNNVALIAKEIHRLTGLLNDFRGLSKGQQLYRFSPTRLQDLLGELCEEQAPIHRALKIATQVEIPDAVPMVSVDRDKLKQALLNLCKNASEAMSDGGTLTVKLEGGEQTVCVEIGDTGCGIPSEVDVFKPFATTKFGGTGLGMPVVRQIVDAHGGTISYDSKPGVGTTFRLELPIAAPGSESPPLVAD